MHFSIKAAWCNCCSNSLDMKSFHCDNCGMMVFFENEHCVKCGENLGFFPDTMEMSSEKKRAASSSAAHSSYRDCANKAQHKVCNWMVCDTDENPFCVACRLNEVIPDLSVEGNQDRWYRLE